MRPSFRFAPVPFVVEWLIGAALAVAIGGFVGGSVGGIVTLAVLLPWSRWLRRHRG